MTERLEILYSLVTKGKIFADVGCDHGYISKAVLDDNRFEKVILSDVSSKSLQKARDLLSSYGDRVEFIVCDGFNGYSQVPTEAIIAGMGGEEIVKILSGDILPNRLILAPQKNAEKVRKTLIEKGYKILRDFTFYSAGKFYDAITAEKGVTEYSPLEILFGKENLDKKPEAFVKKILKEIELLEGILTDETASPLSKERAKIKISLLKGVIK